MTLINDIRFIVDHNVAKLAKWLRMMGYDTVVFDGDDDASMISIALKENRILLTRDTQVMKRRVVTVGRLKAILANSDDPELQMCQVIGELNLNCRHQPFALCLECNQPLLTSTKQDVEGRVPPYVYQTQDQYMECPVCQRIYWRGTHWQKMTGTMERFATCMRKGDKS